MEWFDYVTYANLCMDKTYRNVYHVTRLLVVSQHTLFLNINA